MMLFSSTTASKLEIWLLLHGICSLALGLPSAKIYRNAVDMPGTKTSIQTEPSCEELKAMWRFSKRQSRAAELTNELPMYRDPFAENVWEPYYATSRSIGGMRIGGIFAKSPIYGRLVHRPPYMRIEDPVERQKAFEELTRLYGMHGHAPEPRRRLTTFRLSGGGHLTSLGYPPQQGSFNHLKELIKTERARELQQQRVAEESAAKAAAMNEMGKNQPGRYTTDHYTYDMAEPEEIMFSNEDNMEEDNNGGGSGGIITFPDLLAPAASHPNGQVARFASDYVPYAKTTNRARSHSHALFDTSSFTDPYNGYIL